MKETFTCDSCGKTYPKGWTDEEAMQETQEMFGSVPIDDCNVICDDCYKIIMEN